ncbi:peptidoglycan-associated lipoprotein Pal [Marivivens donghaensis]|uniref:Peptidoglycan-associated lipoprotein n=1 Tax=Marivivens donghaensis TaxID=1699413 RepID=A0ABX0VVU7_9RHOB|nr:peptidoglycan-associated lipoprotein Pal [Marivivens donghaensis]NIY72203.1 peptidoglycan-associated lipoprotein Pal [Marivivens donghaensis]
MRSTLTKAALAVLVLGTAACTNPNRFGANSNSVDLNANGAYGAGANGMAADPSSPAYFQQTIGDRVLFNVDQSTLTPAAMQTLDGQVQWLMTNLDYTAVIEGHADEQGTREYNLALGARRANAVYEYLVSKGIPASRIRTVSYGKERPAATCANESCYTQNRRAVTVINIAALS